MAAEGSGRFFSRWSRRKLQGRSGQTGPAEPPVQPSVRPPVLPPVWPPRSVPGATGAAPVPAHDRSLPRAGAPPPARAGTEEPVAPAATCQAPAPLSLDDVARLTPDGDFTPFMARQVAPEVRNAAVKKLFSDPHFNLMDGLDVYIDDYSKPSPLSPADMAAMVSAQFLKLVDDPNGPKPAAAVATGVTDTDTAPPPAPAEAVHHTEPQAEPEPLAEAPLHPLPDPASAEEPREAHDDHAHLQLQPDHAPERQGPGRGAG